MIRNVLIFVLLVAVVEAKVKDTPECSSLRMIFTETPKVANAAVRSCSTHKPVNCKILAMFVTDDVRKALFDIEKQLGCQDEMLPSSPETACQMIQALPETSIATINEIYVVNGKPSWQSATLNVIPRVETAITDLTKSLMQSVCNA